MTMRSTKKKQAAACPACATDGIDDGGAPRKALAVDDKAGLVTRLKRIEGQVRGLQQMIEDERYCPDVLAQISAVESALRGVSRAVVKNHLRHCATHALRSDDAAERERMIEELVEILGR